MLLLQAAAAAAAAAAADAHCTSSPAQPACGQPALLKQDTSRQGKRVARRSAGQERLTPGPGTGLATADASDVVAGMVSLGLPRLSKEGGPGPAGQVQSVREASRRGHKPASALKTAGQDVIEQGRAGPSSPAVIAAAAAQVQAGQGRTGQRDRQGRAAPSSPALTSPGGTVQTHHDSCHWSHLVSSSYVWCDSV